MKKMSFSKVMSMIAMFSLTSGFIACSSDDKDDVTNNDPTVESESLNVCPDGNHPHLIDLGLPSGKKWGTTPDNKTELDLDDDAAYASNIQQRRSRFLLVIVS
ncbi:MAG: hypothetical protein K6F89_07195 [Prevotella sp.]|nr:hypothetical protein [Prevotella sp.]